MNRFTIPLIAAAAGAVILLGSSSALAHGSAAGGALGGLTHPLLGLDHLFMLIAVGTAAALISAQLLLWALGGAFCGAVLGMAGWSIPTGELLAALSICAVGALALLVAPSTRPSSGAGLLRLSGALVGAGVAIHAMLHGLEAPQDGTTLVWWSGALLSSALVCGGSYLLLKPLPLRLTKAAATALLVIGGLLALGPLGLLAAGAGT